MVLPNDGFALPSISGRPDRLGRHRCIGFGRIIDTDVPIRGTLPLEGVLSSARTIRVRWHDPEPPPGDPIPLWSMLGTALCFAAPGVARYLCTSGSIDIIPTSAGSRGMIDALLIATALPAVLWLQGGYVLHAAAVVPKGESDALAIAGPSGCGKSTLAAAFVASGGALVADDSIVVEADAGHFACAGLAGGYHLGLDGEGDRSFHVAPERSIRRSLALRAIVLLDDGPLPASRSRLTALDALRALLLNRHRPNVPRFCGLEPGLLENTARLARNVPIYRWPRRDAEALLEGDIREAVMRGATSCADIA